MSAFRIRRAVLSVTDKSGLVELARALVGRDVQLFASGGTAQHLQNAGVETTGVEELTHFPEMLDGRVKTLHPGILAGVLADKQNPAHRQDLEKNGLVPVDLVVVNFYAFEAAAKSEALPIEAIDIGGPTLVRAAAKNFASVAVLTSPLDYPDFLAAFARDAVDLDFRRGLATRAFARVADYDRAIATHFLAGSGPAAPELQGRRYAPGEALRYGENPHQQAKLWLEQPPWGLGAAKQRGGDALSYNNYMDADGALDLVFDLGERPACAIVKHNTPCGAAQGATASAAFTAALECDPVSAFGGVVGFNTSVDAETASALASHFFEVVCAPSFAPVALEILQAKKRLRLLAVRREPWNLGPLVARELHGALLVQDRDHGFDELGEMEVATRAQPTPSEREDATFLWIVAKHVRSNAIVVGRERRTLGIGAGQMSRVDSCDLAVSKARHAGHDLSGSIAASDAFFPFPDGVERLAEAGVRVIVQPGGSKRDAEVLSVADRLGICMLLARRRHFRH
ncbi:MAG TPA: bifunctional phosphoribosylaminoimidazolecarboxamide formyltransferase/IMP cyclohydrolase [Candidatus Krumholzibacteria bacterium]|nr:bifunctional phosphoribosylaminoimidazolecarboxamide formyltransferase/IMP cyclohydrolase [Candidatus Krumholzibacteria bacterium]